MPTAPAGGETALPYTPVAGKSVIKIWMGGDEGRFITDSKLQATFEQQFPQYQLQITQLPWDVMHDKLVAGFAAGGGDIPDVADGADQWMGEFAALGGLQSLDDFYAQRGIKDSDFMTDAWQHFVYVDGHRYAAPFYYDTRLLYYRPDMLKAAGIAAPPTTFDELLADAKKLSNGTNVFGLADQTQWLDFHFFSYLLYASGGDYYNADRTKCTLTDPPGIEALTFYKQLYDANAMPHDAAKRADPFTGFATGYYAMAESGGWWWGLMQAQHPELGSIGTGKWDVAFLPSNKTTAAYGHPNSWIVPIGAKNKQGAYDWIAFMERPDIGIQWTKISGELMPTLAQYNDPSMANDRLVQMSFKAAARGVNSIHNIPGAEEITAFVWNALGTLKDDKATPEEAAKSVCDQMQQYLFTP